MQSAVSGVKKGKHRGNLALIEKKTHSASYSLLSVKRTQTGNNYTRTICRDGITSRVTFYIISPWQLFYNSLISCDI